MTCHRCGYALGSLGCDSVCGVVVVPTEAWDSARRVQKALAGIPQPKAPQPLRIRMPTFEPAATLEEFVKHITRDQGGFIDRRKPRREANPVGDAMAAAHAGLPGKTLSLDEFIDHVQAREPEQQGGEGGDNADPSRARAFCVRCRDAVMPGRVVCSPCAAQLLPATHEARLEQVRARAAARVQLVDAEWGRRADQLAADCLRAANLAAVQKQQRRRGDAQAQRLAAFAVSLVLLGVALVIALGAADVVGALR